MGLRLFLKCPPVLWEGGRTVYVSGGFHLGPPRTAASSTLSWLGEGKRPYLITLRWCADTSAGPALPDRLCDRGTRVVRYHGRFKWEPWGRGCICLSGQLSLGLGTLFHLIRSRAGRCCPGRCWESSCLLLSRLPSDGYASKGGGDLQPRPPPLSTLVIPPLASWQEWDWCL